MEVLKLLALRGAMYSPVRLTTVELGRELGMSQQNASNMLNHLEEEGYISRDGKQVQIEERGKSALRREYMDYVRIFHPRMEITLQGAVVQGLGEGRYYISQKGYRKQFNEKLGFEPFPGTLNVRVYPEHLEKLGMLRAGKGIPIDGFVKDGRSFGAVKCFRAEINGHSCAVIIPVRTHHLDVLEVIAEAHLRRRLKLREGDTVSVHVRMEDQT